MYRLRLSSCLYLLLYGIALASLRVLGAAEGKGAGQEAYEVDAAHWRQSGPFGRLHGRMLGGGRGSGSGGAKPLDTAKVSVSRKEAIVATVELGTPPQVLHCLVDSGSADLWVPSRKCVNCERKHAVFSSPASKTFQPAMQQTMAGDLEPVKIELSYGSGSIAGYRVRDTVTFGNVTVYKQEFIIGEYVDLPPDLEWDGILGLAWESMASAGEPFYRGVERSGVVPIFTFTPGTQGTGRIRVGPVPMDVIKPDSLAWAAAEPPAPGHNLSFWITTGGLAIHQKDPRPTRFIVDTGTNFLLAPPKDYLSLVTSIIPDHLFSESCKYDEENELCACLCEVATYAELLPLRFYLGDKVFVLPASKLFLETGDEAGDGRPICLLQVQPNVFTSEVAGTATTTAMAMAASTSTDTPLDTGAATTTTTYLPLWTGSPFGTGQTTASININVEEVKDTVSVGPDGKACTTRVIIENGEVVNKITDCTQAARRRLTDGSSDTWILGGCFLEHFVVSFDFQGSRLGFGYPVGADGDQSEDLGNDDQRKWQQSAPSSLRASSQREASSSQSRREQVLGGSACFVAATAFVLVGIGFAASLIQSRHPRHLPANAAGEFEEESEDPLE